MPAEETTLLKTIISAAWLTLGVVGSYEIIIVAAVSARFGRLGRACTRVFFTLSSPRISDHWKAISARHYAVDVFSSTVYICFSFVIASAPLLLALWAISGSLCTIIPLIFRLDVFVAVSGLFVGYSFLRDSVISRV